MTTLPVVRENYKVTNGPAVQLISPVLRSTRPGRFTGCDDRGKRTGDAVDLAVPAKLGVRVKLPPLLSPVVAATQRRMQLADTAASPYHLLPQQRSRRHSLRRRAGADASQTTALSGELPAAARTLAIEISAASHLPAIRRQAGCASAGHLEYATGALRIVGQNAPGYDELHERLSHLPQITVLPSSWRPDPHDNFDEGFASQDAAASRPLSKSNTFEAGGSGSSSGGSRYGHGDDSSEFVERRIREILKSEGVLDVAPAFFPKLPSSLPPLQELATTDVGVGDTRRHRGRHQARSTGRTKAGLTTGLGHLVTAAQRAVSVRMAVWRSYNRLAAAAAKAARPSDQRAHRAPHLPPL